VFFGVGATKHSRRFAQSRLFFVGSDTRTHRRVTGSPGTTRVTLNFYISDENVLWQWAPLPRMLWFRAWVVTKMLHYIKTIYSGLSKVPSRSTVDDRYTIMSRYDCRNKKSFSRRKKLLVSRQTGRLQPGYSEPWSSCRKWAVNAKFHYASWFGAGSKLVRSSFELKFGLSSSLLAANYSTS